ncbi:MAG: cytochrome bc complex cytochrome b subunit [Pseudobdellovibrionaceae bacterium]
MSSGERAEFKNPVISWIDERLPVFTMMKKEYGVFPTPKNFNYFWNFGAIAMFMLIIMIVTGITLAMHYAANAGLAFGSVERIMRDVNYGWLIRYVHANGASFFFIAVYVHIFRGLYYGSYKKPRELLWMFGVLIFLLMMATAFMGYVLPWGQMSFWGAQVITSFFTAIPFVGEGITEWLRGGFAIDNATLNRFFALHYLLPFVILGVVFIHVWALHVTGSNNPLGIDAKGPQDTLPFNPYYTVKDTFGLMVFLIVYAIFVFFMPNSLGHPDNYIPANPMVTPAHIVPEWYFLPFYAILRAFTFGVNVYLGIGAALLAAALYPVYVAKAKSDVNLKMVGGLMALGGVFALLGYFSQYEVDGKALLALPFAKAFVDAKLCGVLAMFGSIAILFVLPFMDKHPVRSAVFRPWFKIGMLLLVVDFFILMLCGSKPAEGFWVPLSQISMLYYLGFFLVGIPFLSVYEPIKALPESIHKAVLAKSKKGA